MNIALEEADESLYWLELAVDSGLLSRNSVDNLLREANELTAIFTTSIKTARKRLQTEKQEVRT
jgi:four helix bundle protein